MTTFFILITGALVQILLGFTFKDWISYKLFETDYYAKHIFIVLITSSLNFIGNLFYMLLRFERKSKNVVIINILKLLLSVPLILFFLIQLKLEVLSPILANLIVSIIIFISLFVLTIKHFTFGINKAEIKLQLSWGLAIVIGNFGVLSLNWVDRFFINQYCTLSDVGIYSLGYNIGMVINLLLVFPFMEIYNPMRMEYRHDKNADEFYKRILIYFLMIGLTMVTFLSVYSKDILKLMSSRPEYIDAYTVVPWVGMSYLIVGMGGLTNNGILFSRKVHIVAYIYWGCAIVNIILNLIFIPRIGYMAAAYTTLFSFALGGIILIIISQKLYKQEYDIKKIAILFLTSIIAIYISNKASVVNNTILKTIIMMFALLVYYQVLDKKEKKKILTIIIKKIRAVKLKISKKS